MRHLGARVGGLLLPGDVVCLAGDLGAGKTTLAQGIAVGLGVEGPVTSPTFTIIHEYRGRIPFYHVDAYRLERPEELEDLGLEEYIFGDGVTVIEWADRVTSLLPDNYLEVSIQPLQGEGRLVTVKAVGTGPEKLVEELEKECEY
ncbi:hypothetical protein SY88_09205 [Clostridiales bacterium PH28_bin88]|nr:hypothetical protein SY88_09205 [Clostridiales bacterium PH28_bin88]